LLTLSKYLLLVIIRTMRERMTYGRTDRHRGSLMLPGWRSSKVDSPPVNPRSCADSALRCRASVSGVARRHLVGTANTLCFLTLDGKTRDPECEGAHFGKRRLNGSQTGSREKVKTRTLKPQGCGPRPMTRKHQGRRTDPPFAKSAKGRPPALASSCCLFRFRFSLSSRRTW
jgi:hypothetical protein